jgi:hypothetical protein
MGHHIARLIITVIFIILAFSSLVTGRWFLAIFWALLTVAVGHPFYQDGKINLSYVKPPKSKQ